MRRLVPLLLLVLLAACAPRLQALPDRDGQLVTITVEANGDLFAVTLAVLNATTTDARCAVQGSLDADLGCILGDLPAGSSTSVVVSGEPGQVYCAAFAFVRDPPGVTDIRAYPCKVS